MTLYKKLIAMGVSCNHWQSDLYFPVTPETTKLVKAHNEGANYQVPRVTRFTSADTGEPMYELAFGYDPYWEN
jgi:hypothetical protein